MSLFDEWVSLVGAETVASLSPQGPLAPLDAKDALLVIDMQKDFVPADAVSNPDGGKFGVAEGAHIVAPIIDLIDGFVAQGATVAATRDYHPIDHCSFSTQGGPFPCHCVQGTEGSKFLPPIGAALADGVRQAGSDKVFVAFKALHEHIDSFGALPCTPPPLCLVEAHDGEEHARMAAARTAYDPYRRRRCCCCSASAWTCDGRAVDALLLPYRRCHLVPAHVRSRSARLLCSPIPPDDKFYAGGTGRICRGPSLEPSSAPAGGFAPSPMGCSAAPWTGALVMKQSAYTLPKEGADASSVCVDMDAPPDALAAVEDGVPRGLANLQTALRGKKRLFVCGLALDFCVLDTCLNARDCGFEEVFMVYDAARAAHIHGVGSHGSGFLTDPQEVVAKLRAAGVRLVTTASLLGHGHGSEAATAASAAAAAAAGTTAAAPVVARDNEEGPAGFPHALGALSLRLAPAAKARILRQGGGGGSDDAAPAKYTLALDGDLALLSTLGASSEGYCSPATPLPEGWPGAPPGAAALRFASPLDHVASELQKGAASLQHLFLSISASPALSFAAYGGFLLLDTDRNVVAVQAIGQSPKPEEATLGSLEFAPPQAVPSSAHSGQAWRAQRFNPITFPSLRRNGATHYRWVGAHEAALAKEASLKVGPNGGFLYLRRDDEPSLYFQLLSPPPMHVDYLTDVEGNWEYFCAWVSRSTAVQERGPPLADGSLDLTLTPGWQLVFGGDSVDKGGAVGGSVRVVRSLVRLKERYGSRVTLLIGNRDANKMRLTSELDPSQLDPPEMLDTLPGPYWVPPSKSVSPKAYLTKLAAERAGVPKGEPIPTADAATLRTLNTPFNRLRWMLIETMGSAGEEERRRAELSAMANGRPISDDLVFASFMSSVQPGGFMRRYLELGQIAAVINGTLYVHGGVISDSYGDQLPHCVGVVPGRKDRVAGVGEWVHALNAWKDKQVAAWIAQPLWRDAKASPALVQCLGGYDERGGQELMNYGVNGSPAGVVLGRHLEKNGMPKLLPADVLAMLASGGVSRLVVGHTPHGNCPTPIRQPGFLTLFGDSSFSDMKAGDNRGKALSTISILVDGTVSVRGLLHDEREIRYTIEPSLPLHDPIGCIEPELEADGTPNTNRRFVKARLVTPSGDSGDLLMCRVDGFKVEYSTLGYDTAQRRLGLPSPESAPVGISHQFSNSSNDDKPGVTLADASSRLDSLIDLFLSIDVNGNGQLEQDEVIGALTLRPDLCQLLLGASSPSPSSPSSASPSSSSGGSRKAPPTSAAVLGLFAGSKGVAVGSGGGGAGGAPIGIGPIGIGPIGIESFLSAFEVEPSEPALARWREKRDQWRRGQQRSSASASAAAAAAGGSADATAVAEARRAALSAERRAESAEAKLAGYWEDRARAAEARAKQAEEALARAMGEAAEAAGSHARPLSAPSAATLPSSMLDARDARAGGGVQASPSHKVMDVSDAAAAPPDPSTPPRPSLIPVPSPKRMVISPASSPRSGGGASGGGALRAESSPDLRLELSAWGAGTPGRHSAHLLMSRCITELSRMVDELRVPANHAGAGGAGGGGMPLGAEAAVAARLAKQVAALKGLHRRQGSAGSSPMNK